MTEHRRLAEFLARIPDLDTAVLQEWGGLEQCESPGDPGPTREWRLPSPWAPIRVPDDMGDIEGMTSEDAPARCYQNSDGDTLQLFFLPAGPSAGGVLSVHEGVPGTVAESRCARVFDNCVIVITRWHVEQLGLPGSIVTAVVIARTGDALLATVGADRKREGRILAAVYDLAQRGPLPPPRLNQKSAPLLRVGFHPSYGGSKKWEVIEPRPRDTSWIVKEARDSREHFSLERIRTRWYFPTEGVDPELVRIHEEEVREFVEEIVIFREGELEQNRRHARSTMLTLVIENKGDLAAEDVRVRLRFPSHLLVGSYGTIYGPRIQPPDQPRILQIGPGFLKERRKRIERKVEIGNLEAAAKEDNWAGYEQHVDGSLTVTYQIDRVKARTAPNLTKACLMFRRWEDIASVTIGWEVSATGVTPTSGDLEIPVRISTVAEQDARDAEFETQFRDS